MLELKILYYLLGFIFLSTIIHAQDFSKETLQKLGDEKLLSLFNEVENDSIMAEKVARVYFDRARKENDTIKMARGYDRLARIFHPEKNIQFADSIIFLTKNMDNITYPGLGYLIKGYEYRKIGNLILSNKYDLICYALAVKNRNIAHEIFISDKLIATKSFWGNKREALELQKKRHEIIKDKNYIKKVNKTTREGAKVYFDDLHLNFELSSIVNFIICYINLKKLDSADIYLKKGIKKNKIYQGNNHKRYDEILLQCSIEINYYRNNFTAVLDSINKLMLIIDKNNIKEIKDIYLFKGLSLINLNKKKEGINYLKKTDSIFSTNKIAYLPYHRILYENLFDYFDKKDDIDNKIKYLNKLIFVDSIYKKNYQFFDPDLIRNYETPKLLKEKEVLIATLKQKNKKSTSTVWWFAGLLSLSLFILMYYYKKQRKYKNRFDVLMSQNGANHEGITQSNSNNNKISKIIINNILDHLDRFEIENKFLSSSISLQSMANSFKTNYKYLSKVINLNKGKRFSNYINELRVNYTFHELKINPKYRKFTIKAIAKESGFKSAESFSKSFYKVYGIYPSFYLKQLESKEEIN